MQMREKVGKSRHTVFFQWFEAPEGRKVGSLKRRVRSHLARWAMKNCTPLWREAHFRLKMYKAHQGSDHFWKLRYRKSARFCGAKHVSKSKCTTHLMFGPLLEVEMSKKCTLLWREARFQVKMYKAQHSRTTFGHSELLSRGRRKGLCTLSKVSKTWGFCSMFNCNHHYTTPHANTSHYTTTTTTPSLHSTHYTPLHYTPRHYTTLNYTQLHSITFNYIQLRSITLHYTTLPSTTLH